MTRRRPPSNEVVQLEDCAITIKRAMCCGVAVYWADLPGSYIDRRGLRRSSCCEEASHGSKEMAISCARQRISQGLEIPVPQGAASE